MPRPRWIDNGRSFLQDQNAVEPDLNPGSPRQAWYNSLFASSASAVAASSEPTVVAAFAAFSLEPGAAPRRAREPLVPSLQLLSALLVALPPDANGIVAREDESCNDVRVQEDDVLTT